MTNLQIMKTVSNDGMTRAADVTITGKDNSLQNYYLKQYFLHHGGYASKNAAQMAIRERKVLVREANSTRQSPFMPILYRSFLNQCSVCLVLKMPQAESLASLLSHGGLLPEPRMAVYAAELICALEHLHGLRVVHMAVTPENVLITASGHVLLSNFTCSYDFSYPGRVPKSDDFIGDFDYMAPEVANHHSISKAADVWSLAMTLGKATLGQLRESTSRDLEEKRRLAEMGVWEIPKSLPVSIFFYDFLDKCLQTNPFKRAGLKVLKHNQLFANINWALAANGKLIPPINMSEMWQRRNPDTQQFGSDTQVKELIEIPTKSSAKKKALKTFNLTRETKEQLGKIDFPPRTNSTFKEILGCCGIS